jgi:hypothetical protein
VQGITLRSASRSPSAATSSWRPPICGCASGTQASPRSASDGGTYSAPDGTLMYHRPCRRVRGRRGLPDRTRAEVVEPGASSAGGNRTMMLQCSPLLRHTIANARVALDEDEAS